MGESKLSRRGLLKWSGAAGIMAIAGPLPACAPQSPGGPLVDENGLVLPPGFSSRIIAQGGQNVPNTNFPFRWFPDGATTFADTAVPGGWYYTMNHEIPLNGGVSSIRFAPDGTITEAFSVLEGTSLNCAGGPTPWGTWLSGEEFDWGSIWECDPTSPSQGKRRAAMGQFAHEGAAVGSDDRVYMTEDRGNGGFYRFTPNTPGDLSSGLLEIATYGDTPRPSPEGTLIWEEVPYPDAPLDKGFCRTQLENSIEFDGGEGIDTVGDLVWFTTKGDDRIWEYDVVTAEIKIRFQAGGGSILDGVDNLYADEASNTLLIAEDGDNMEIVAIREDSSLDVLVQVHDQEHSEVTGPTFSPDGTRLYFGSQRGGVGETGVIIGLVYEVTGPFDEWLGRV